MIKSELILPIRFYDNFFNQERFSRLTEVDCMQYLVYPKNELPSFQLNRNKSLTIPSVFFLKNTCNDGDFNNIHLYKKIVDKGADTFTEPIASNFYINYPMTAGGIYDNGVDPPSGVLFDFSYTDCGLLKNKPFPAYTTMDHSSKPEFSFYIDSVNRFKVKIVVEEFLLSVGSSFTIDIWNGASGTGTLLKQIDAVGVYEIDFVSNDNLFTISFNNFADDDVFGISYIQAERQDFSSLSDGDFELDETQLKVIPMTDGKDVISYCETSQNYQVKPGIYYYVIVDGTNTYFSEIFQIKSFLEIEKLYKLTWFSDCDLNGKIIYNSEIVGCEYKNILYLDAALFNPKYEIDEEVKTNGKGDEISVFRRWQKSRTLDVACPEFIADALSGVFLHNNILLREPLSEFQDFTNNEYSILKVVGDVTPILSDRLQRVLMILILSDKFWRAGCCDSSNILTCNPEKYIAVNSCTGADTYELILSTPPASGDGLYDCDGTLIEPDEENIIYNSDTNYYYQLRFISGIWQAFRIFPKIDSVSTLVPGFLIIFGKAMPYTWIELFVNKNGAGYISYGVIEIDSSGEFGFPISDTGLVGATDLKFKIENSSLNCSFGQDIFDFI